MAYDGSNVVPVPSPISRRPPETWSSVNAWRANIAGLRRAICVTEVASLIELVTPASPVRAVHDSNHGLAGRDQSTK